MRSLCNRRQVLRGGLALAGVGLLVGCDIVTGPVGRVRIPHIGYIGRGAGDGIPGPGYAAFQDGMRDLGHVEGRTYTVDSFTTQGQTGRVPELVSELVRRKAALICTSGTPTVLAARQVTSDIPIVVAATGDLVALGLIDSLRQPGGNVTGAITLAPQLSGKRLELLRELVPRIARIGLLAHTDILDKGLESMETRAAARALGLALEVVSVRARDELEGAFAVLVGAGVQGLLVAEDPYYAAGRDAIIALAAQHRLPAIYTLQEFVHEGGLMSYGANFVEAHQRAAAHADRILKGARSADLPVEQPTEFELVINLAAAGSLGMTIPQSVLQQATDVIQ